LTSSIHDVVVAADNVEVPAGVVVVVDGDGVVLTWQHMNPSSGGGDDDDARLVEVESSFAASIK